MGKPRLGSAWPLHFVHLLIAARDVSQSGRKQHNQHERIKLLRAQGETLAVQPRKKIGLDEPCTHTAECTQLRVTASISNRGSHAGEALGMIAPRQRQSKLTFTLPGDRRTGPLSP